MAKVKTQTGLVKSPLFGTLALLHAEEDSVVEEGDMVGEVESMKTFFRVHATGKGKIHWRVALGEVVGEDDVLAEILEEKVI